MAAMYKRFDMKKLKYPVAHYSSDVRIIPDLTVKKIKDTRLTSLKRGTGGRSSFNGIVCTVFGATGFMGRYIVNGLGKIGTQLIIPYRGEPFDHVDLKLAGDLGQVLYHPFHLRDENSIRQAVKYSNVVINLIGRNYETSNFNYADVYIHGPRRIARICKEMGVERFIHFSSLNVCEKPQGITLPGGSEILRTKWLGEQVVRDEFPEATIFRPADIWGEEDCFLRLYGQRMRLFPSRTLYLWNSGVGTIKQPVDCSDVAAGVVEVVKDPYTAGKIYQAVGPKRYHLPELVDYIYLMLNKDRHVWGYNRADARYNPAFWLYVTLIGKCMVKHPMHLRLNWERFEREHITDTLEEGLYTLEDLGIKLTRLEDVIKSLTWWIKAFAHYDDRPHEFPIPPDPPGVIDK